MFACLWSIRENGSTALRVYVMEHMLMRTTYLEAGLLHRERVEPAPCGERIGPRGASPDAEYRARRRHGFTLIELLVVVSIIALLIAILLPSLSKAMASARQVVCASNERQMGMAVMTYGLDHKQYFPAGVNRSNGDWIWPPTLRRELAGAMDVFYCPAADPKTRWVRKLGSGLAPDVYGWQQDEYHLGSGRGSWFSYGYNVWGYPFYPGNALGTGTYHNVGGSDGYQTMSSVVAPATFIVLGDSNWDLNTLGDVNWSAYIGGYAPRQYPGAVHVERVNTLRGDGHAETERQDELITAAFNDQVNRQWNRDNRPHW
ncbi:MAG: prepilin-type N-terminal cleavage/methylation domain-containing protein [Planctomycetes bacterium]|nr:prepilin-type N-terminal cleavage/methylation domain-containing protein [Planctomycetota bacterium]